MLIHNEKLNRVSLFHGKFAERSDIERLKGVIEFEMQKVGASRGQIRFLSRAHEDLDDNNFKIEGKMETRSGIIHVMGADLKPKPSEIQISAHYDYLSRVVSRPKRQVPVYSGIVRLGKSLETAQELESIYIEAFRGYPVSLDSKSILGYLGSSIPYAVIEDGRIVSVLFGDIYVFDTVHAIELTMCATVPSKRGIGMTAALAARIKEEAERRFPETLVFAETPCTTVMHSCHDFGMAPRGLMANYSFVVVGGRAFTDLHLWSL